MNKIAILYICTGQYSIFWKDFYDSYEKLFLPDSHKEYFVFTDAHNIYQENNKKVHLIYQKSLGWPDNTLMRYHMFCRIKDNLQKFDFVYFMNANCLCVDYISETEFCNINELLVVQHPGFYNKSNIEFTYDRNPKSTAYIPIGEGQFYICGGINGGKTNMFISAIETMKKNIDADYKNNVIALWHDESHINRYIIDHPNYTMLSPSYCYPEGWVLPFKPKIIVRDKSKILNVNKIKRNNLFYKIFRS